MYKYIIRYKKNNKHNKKTLEGYAQAAQEYEKIFLKAQEDRAISSGSLEFCESGQSVSYMLQSFGE